MSAMLRWSFLLLIILVSPASARDLNLRDIVALIAADHAQYEPLTSTYKLRPDRLNSATIKRLQVEAKAYGALPGPDADGSCDEASSLVDHNGQPSGFSRVDAFLQGRPAVIHTGAFACREGSRTIIWLQDAGRRSRKIIQLEGELRFFKRGAHATISLIVKDANGNGQKDRLAFYDLASPAKDELTQTLTDYVVIGSTEVPDSAIAADRPVLAQPVSRFVMPDGAIGEATDVYSTPDPDADARDELNLYWDGAAIPARTPLRVHFTYGGDGGLIWRYVETLTPFDRDPKGKQAPRYLGWILPEPGAR